MSSIRGWKGMFMRLQKVRACEQWTSLYEELAKRTEVKLVEPVQGLPDMVFTANAGLRFGDEVALSRFQFAERQGEAEVFAEWLARAGLKVRKMPAEMSFEGEGDALWAADGGRLWAGWGFRTAVESHRLLEDWWGVEVASLRLIDPRFYHLDTCFAPLPNGDVMYFPEAFDEASRMLIEEYYPGGEAGQCGRRGCNGVLLQRGLCRRRVSAQPHFRGVTSGVS